MGGASRLGYLTLCSIVSVCVFQLVWLRRSCFRDTVALFFLTIFCLVSLSNMSFSCDHSLDGSFPPSPAEDRVTKRLSWGSLLQKLTELKGINQSTVTVDQQCSRSETGECCSLLSHCLLFKYFSFICVVLALQRD